MLAGWAQQFTCWKNQFHTASDTFGILCAFQRFLALICAFQFFFQGILYASRLGIAVYLLNIDAIQLLTLIDTSAYLALFQRLSSAFQALFQRFSSAFSAFLALICAFQFFFQRFLYASRLGIAVYLLNINATQLLTLIDTIQHFLRFFSAFQALFSVVLALICAFQFFSPRTSVCLQVGHSRLSSRKSMKFSF